jgi:hypothetical protein
MVADLATTGSLVVVRANLKVKATLAPLEELPEDTGILVVRPELREAAHELAPPGTPILVTAASSAAAAFGDLVSRLEADTELRGKSRSRAGGGAAEDRQLHGLYALFKIDHLRQYAQLDAILDGTIKPHRPHSAHHR